MGDFSAGPASLKIWFSSSRPGARYLVLDDATSEGFLGCFLPPMGIASGAGALALGSGLAFVGGGRGTVVLVSLASGLTNPGRDGSGMLFTTLTPMAPPPGF